MIPQDLEELLKTATHMFSDEDPLQELVDRVVAKLQADGRKFVITKVFAENLLWVDQKVTVPDYKDEQKVILVQNKPFASTYRLDIEYYYPDEVKEF